MTKTVSARRLAAAGLIGAAYLALCAAFPALSFGQIQYGLPKYSPCCRFSHRQASGV